MTRTKIFCLLGNFLSHLSVRRSLVARIGIVTLFVAALLESCQGLVVTLSAIVAYLNLMEVRGTLFVYPVFEGIGPGKLVRHARGFGSFKLISLLEAHLEVVLPLCSYLLIHCALVIDILSRLGHTTFVL